MSVGLERLDALAGRLEAALRRLESADRAELDALRRAIATAPDPSRITTERRLHHAYLQWFNGPRREAAEVAEVVPATPEKSPRRCSW